MDERWRRNNPAQYATATQSIYEGRRAALDDIIADLLIIEAARSGGSAVEQYTAREVSKRLEPVTDADVLSFFLQNQAQMQGRGLPELELVIRRLLEEQRRVAARQALASELRSEARDVAILLDPPRRPMSIAQDDPALGPADALVTVVEFSDFQCPFCQRVAPVLKQLKDTYGDRVRIVWKDFPLTRIHREAFKAAEAANCANEQGRFWEYHDALFANQEALTLSQLKQYAVTLELDETAFNRCLDSGRYSPAVQQDLGIGSSLGINATPAVFINGRQFSGAQPYDVFAAAVDEELQRAAVPQE